nr:GIY-YIG nuclease family protein [Bacillus sp. AFS096315]
MYFLFGKDEDNAKMQVYIGEAENVNDRIKQHNREKDFWELAIAVLTNNIQNQFTKTDVKYLELCSFEKATEINRFKIPQTKPANSFVPEWRKCDLFDIFKQ